MVVPSGEGRLMQERLSCFRHNENGFIIRYQVDFDTFRGHQWRKNEEVYKLKVQRKES
jgi:hypothetical protein